MPTRIQLSLLVFIQARLVLGADAPSSQPMPKLPDELVASVRITPGIVERQVSPTFIGINLNPGAPRAALISDAAVIQRVRGMGMKTIRFPNGCVADQYNWKSPQPGMVTVEQFLDFCDAIDAEPYYTLNLQGGTEGLEGKPPQGAGVDDIIRYRHTAPNPCGNTDYHFGTLAEAVELLEKYAIERAIAGKRPILHFELGNENWGQGATDWPPEVYGKTCEVFASTLRGRFAEARRRNPQLASMELYIVAVGYPTMGNNQDAFADTNHDVNVRWTREINRLADLKLIDAVQEHFYPYGNADGSTLLWTVHNLENIIRLRYGAANPRLNGYLNRELAYKLPMEWTEWNVKCWGPQPATNLPLVNSDFSQSKKGWTSQVNPADAAEFVFVKAAARRGARGLRIQTQASCKSAELRQAFSVADRKPTALLGAAVWVRTMYPSQTKLLVRQANDGPSKGVVLGSASATQIGMWERIVAAGAPKPDTTDVEIVLQAEGAGVTSWFDEVQPLHWATTSGAAPLVAARFEQQLFIVDALRVLLNWPTPRTHLHHLIGNYPCGTLQQDGTPRDNAVAFEFLHDRIGRQVVRTVCDAPTFNYNTPADKFATDFNALAPDMTDVPVLSAVTTRDDDRLFVLLVNRTSDRPIKALIDLGGAIPLPMAEARTLMGEDFDVPGAQIATAAFKCARQFTCMVPPHSAQILSIRLGGK